ncbi:HIRAN domain-containing protein [Curtobacterium sp. UNCCL17]|uniref:HIRAN domain-containing protein n=1 Tax=Curtobacterium sp. UNCCL17 TaxID=1449051 RepID=UPI0012DE9FA2|nr:HIRAN domain-containing protein [Curtobacterium sp. UNCCL17]
MTTTTYSVPNATWPNFEVAGESNYEATIRALLGRLAKDQDREVLTEASLVPEPDNPYDLNAVSVRINGGVVGYLTRDDARAFAPVLHRLAASGVTAVVRTRVWGVIRDNWEGTGTRFNSNVRVALPEPHLILPLNDAPSEPYSVLPWGAGLQVTGEDKHFDVLAPFAGRSDRSLLIVTLHRRSEEKARGGQREFVEVRVEGQRVGELSAQSSKHYFALVDHHREKGITVAAWAHVKGSALAAEVVLQAAKASEVDNAYLNGAPVTVPRLVPAARHYQVPPAYNGPARPALTERPKSSSKSAPAAARGQAKKQGAAAAKSGCAVVAVGLLGVGGGFVTTIHQLLS